MGGLIELDMDTTVHGLRERVLENRWMDVFVKGTKLCVYADVHVSVGTRHGAAVSGEEDREGWGSNVKPVWG